MFGARYRSGLIAFFVWTICDTYTVSVHAQSNGTCVCQPGEIEFTLNFALGCDNRTILPGLPGIEDAVCVVTNTGGSTMFDNVPISVSTITVNEIDINLNPLRMENFTGTFLSGDTFTYEAFSVSDTDSVANGTIPYGLQVAITGLNDDDEEIINNFVILFTNDCTIYPVLDTDSTIGWATLVRISATFQIALSFNFPNAWFHQFFFHSLVYTSRRR